MLLFCGTCGTKYGLENLSLSVNVVDWFHVNVELSKIITHAGAYLPIWGHKTQIIKRPSISVSDKKTHCLSKLKSVKSVYFLSSSKSLKSFSIII